MCAITAAALTEALTTLGIDADEYPVERYVLSGGTLDAFDAFVGRYARTVPDHWSTTPSLRAMAATSFFDLFDDLLAVCKVQADLANTLLADPFLRFNRALTVDAALDWANVPVPADRVPVLRAAGITPAEATADPSLADRDADALAVLAALRQPTTTTGTRHD